MATIMNLSHYTVTVPTAQKLEETVAFYGRLGFRVVATAGPPVHAAAQAWLHHFPASAQDERETQEQEVPTALRIVVSAGDSSADAPPSITFGVASVQAAEAALQAAGRPFETVRWPVAGGGDDPTAPAGPVVHTTDPAGTRISLTAHSHAYATTTTTGSPTNNNSSKTPPSSEPSAGAKNAFERSAARKRIGILTSGGDSSGMNAAVRAIARVALQRGCVPYAIHEGYQGLVDGGSMIQEFGWENVRGYLAIGGTTIGTARCAPFRTRDGRLRATLNLIKNGIDALVVIGGDGSLTGADILRDEWPDLVNELIARGDLSEAECAHLRSHLTIVGLVGSIDNDMSATDITIGAVTSLHRICESVDSLTSTAQSHQRAFVVEVMGRHCGWLGLMAGIAVGADWVCVPERPPPLDNAKYGDDWAQEMVDTIKLYRTMGSRKSIVIICEGAIDRNLNPIKPDQVRRILEERLGLDTRVTTLGHVQRGGSPCAFDRYLATVQGVEAVEAVLSSTPTTPSPMIGMSHNKVISVPLMEAVKLTHSVAAAIARKDFKQAMVLRDPEFTSAFDAYIESTLLAGPGKQSVPESQRMRIGIIHCGAPAGGMNAATRVAARLCLNRGHTPIAIRNGFSGLVRDEVRPLLWQELVGWQVRGGSELGTNRDHPRPIPGITPKILPKGVQNFIDLGGIAYHLQKHDIHALLLIGGFEAYTAQVTLTEARDMYPAFAIPMVHLPATISNNVPGTDYSIGSDTALNAIVESCDRLKQSANASRNRVFVVEVQGGNCGYLATLGGLITGATSTYIPERELTLTSLQRDVQHLCRRYDEDKRNGIQPEGRLILRAESTLPKVFSTDVISGIMHAEGRGRFDSRTAILGHLQQGGVPSPLDRIRATRLAVKCIDWIQTIGNASRRNGVDHGDHGDVSTPPRGDVMAYTNIPVYTNAPESSTVIGIRGADIVFSPVQELLTDVDVQARRAKSAWWMGLGKLIRVLAKYEYDE